MAYISFVLPALIAAIAAFGFSMLWYGPVFGREWAALNKKVTQAKTQTFAMSFFRLFVTAYIIGLLFTGMPTSMAVMTIALVWLAFTAMPSLTNVLWSKQPLGLYAINMGFELLSVVLMTIILATWF